MTPTADAMLRQLNEQVAACLRRGRYPQALPLAVRACEQARLLAGEGSPELADSLGRLARTYREMGQPSEAEQPCLQALNIRAAAVGKDHPEYAALNDLALVYEGMGSYPQAEGLYQRARDIRRQTLGEDHPDYAQTLHDLGRLYDGLGRPAEAEILTRQALAIRRRALGEDHVDYADSLAAVARLELQRGRLTEGERLAGWARRPTGHG